MQNARENETPAATNRSDLSFCSMTTCRCSTNLRVGGSQSERDDDRDDLQHFRGLAEWSLNDKEICLCASASQALAKATGLARRSPRENIRKITTPERHRTHLERNVPPLDRMPSWGALKDCAGDTRGQCGPRDPLDDETETRNGACEDVSTSDGTSLCHQRAWRGTQRPTGKSTRL